MRSCLTTGSSLLHSRWALAVWSTERLRECYLWGCGLRLPTTVGTPALTLTLSHRERGPEATPPPPFTRITLSAEVFSAPQTLTAREGPDRYVVSRRYSAGRRRGSASRLLTIS